MVITSEKFMCEQSFSVHSPVIGLLLFDKYKKERQKLNYTKVYTRERESLDCRC